MGRPTSDAYDALVIGGGPAGSTVATLLATAGHKVLVCERERFPRFHVGESLLPYTARLWRRLGVWEKLRVAGFRRKFGAQFLVETGNGSQPAVNRLDFRRSLDGDLDRAFQVRRAEFDRILLDHAAERGAEVRQETTVERVLFAGERAVGARISPTCEEEAGWQALDVEARVVIDASGRGAVLGRQLGLVELDPDLRQAAVFTHLRGVDADFGEAGGDIQVVGGAFGWFWLIPLDDETTSVGCVFPSRVLREMRAKAVADARDADLQAADTAAAPGLAEIFDRLVEQSPTVRRALAPAEPLLPVEATADFSYRCRRFAGDGWLLAGDAAGFLDPVFSSGVLLAMRSGERAADLAARRLEGDGRLRRRDAAAYDRYVRRGLRRFRRYVLAYYDPACLATFLDEPPALLERAVTSSFAGKVFARDPRTWLSDRAFFLQSWRNRQAAARGEIELPPAPARV